MHLPLWLVYLLLPAWLWYVTLPLLVGLIWLAVRFRGRLRWLALTGAAVLVVPPLSAFGVLAVVTFQRDVERRESHARTHSVLERQTTLDGVTLPAGTEITWTDASHTHWTAASFPQTMDFRGLPLRSMIRRPVGWTANLAEPRRIGDWPCAAEAVAVTEEGDLFACRLSEAATWHGWTLPASTMVRLNRAERTVEVFLPSNGTVEGQETGTSLPPLSTLNDDGSLARAFYRREDPLRVAGVPLWGAVSWSYDPATLGLGRNRLPVTVEGTTSAPAMPGQDVEGQEQVVVTVATGVITRRAPGNR